MQRFLRHVLNSAFVCAFAPHLAFGQQTCESLTSLQLPQTTITAGSTGWVAGMRLPRRIEDTVRRAREQSGRESAPRKLWISAIGPCI